MKKALIIMIAAFVALSCVFANGQTESVYPSQGIEFVIPASAGGGSDRMARLLIEIIQKNNLCPQTITATNKAGGSGATGQAYVNASPNPDYVIFTINDAHTLGGNKAGTIPSGNFTQLALLGVDEVLFVTKGDAPYSTMEEAVAAIKANPKSLVVGCADQLDRICVQDINASYGVEFTDTLFGGAGDIATAILGGHVQFGMFNPSECVALINSGDLKALALFSEERTSVAGLENVPTFTEMGHPELVYKMTRGVLGNANMSREAQLFWSDVFEKVCATDDWQKGYCAANGVTPMYMNCDDYSAFYVENEKSLLEKLSKLPD